MTHNIPTELQRYVQERIIPQYAGFDKAHQIDHAEKSDRRKSEAGSSL